MTIRRDELSTITTFPNSVGLFLVLRDPTEIDPVRPFVGVSFGAANSTGSSR
jgi:hypothetical protein